jgi:hypothetical protein
MSLNHVSSVLLRKMKGKGNTATFGALELRHYLQKILDISQV